jgi:outer membrane receptor protein involved in Fe transport
LDGLTAGNVGAVATNGSDYDAAYYCGSHCGGVLPISNVHYNTNRFDNYGGIIDNTRGGVLTWTPYNASYDEDWFQSREVTGEARFDTNFDFPVNFTSGLFYMTFNSENQYWVAANSLDWESAVLGAFLTPCNLPPTGHACSTTPYMLAMPDFDAEYRRGFEQSRSAFLEATWSVFPDELKVIAGGRYNDDKESLLRTTKCTGGGLFQVNEANPTPFSDPCVPAFTPDLYAIGSQVHLPLNTRIPTAENGKKDVTTDLWTGRVSINWTPKLDFTDQTLVYFTASTGELAGGINVPNNGAQTIVPIVYKPATVNALELGTKNTLFDATLTANLTAWYYNYVNYQIVVIANRQALELNIPANLYGLEGEFVWQPTENFAFNLTTSLTHSAAGNVFVPDERNITNRQPNSILVRDLTNGSICVVVPHAFGSTAAAAAGSTPGDSAGNHVDNFYLPAGGLSSQDAGFGIPLVNYGLCGGQGSAAQANLRAKGYDYSTATSPTTGMPVQIQDATARANDIAAGGDGLIHDGTGISRNLHGNRLPQVPFGQVGVGAQYTFHFGDWSIVPRLDYYWQSSMEARVWNDPVVDRINAWDIANGQIQLNAPDSRWYVQVFAKNIFDKHNPTGEYLQDPAAGLYTNVFSEDPRIVGFSVGAHW